MADYEEKTGGDVHQPLHVSFKDERGGNSIGVSAGLCSWDLQAVWDRLHHRRPAR